MSNENQSSSMPGDFYKYMEDFKKALGTKNAKIRRITVAHRLGIAGESRGWRGRGWLEEFCGIITYVDE